MSKGMYTTDIHAERLKEMLRESEPCNCCPATYKFSSCHNPGKMWENKQIPMSESVCGICRAFIGLDPTYFPESRCPCTIFGERAIELTVSALEEGGYV